MTKIRLSEFEISQLDKKIDSKIEDCERIIFNFADMKEIAHFAIAKTMELVDNKTSNYLSLDEAADTLQNILDLTNNKKYKPFINLLGLIGGDSDG